jgi:hypothetical protein
MDNKFHNDNEKDHHGAVVAEKEIFEGAQIATSKEHDLTLRQGLKAYKKAIMWSVLLSSAVIMEGYDTILVSCGFHEERRNADMLTYRRLGHTSDSLRSTILSATRLSMVSPPSQPRGKQQVRSTCALSANS